MKPRRVISTRKTPDGDPIELAEEGEYYVVRVNGVPLMSSGMYGSEQAMATAAAECIGAKPRPRVLIGGLGMGFTLRAALDCLGERAEITVAELLPAVVAYNREELGALAGNPLDDPRVTLYEGDVRDPMKRSGWDAILMDVDNGPEAFTVASNDDFYSASGVARMAGSLSRSGVLVVWSAFESPDFERAVRRAGLALEVRRVRARATGKGPRHVLFLIKRRGQSR